MRSKRNLRDNIGKKIKFKTGINVSREGYEVKDVEGRMQREKEM